MKILVFGEILWDIIGDKAYIGGAPFNLASHSSNMGLHSYLVTSVGDDFLGKSALKSAKNHNIHMDYVSESSKYPTGAVEVTVNEQGIPNYVINEDVAWDNIQLSEEQLKEIANTKWDVFCFGTLAQRTETNRTLLSVILENINAKEIFFDINLRQDYFDKKSITYSLSKSTIVKLNDEESFFLDKYLFSKEGTLDEFAERLRAKFNIKILCITKGPAGADIYHEDKKYSVPGVKITVADTVGAGDSFCAGFLASYLSGNSLEKSGELAVQVAGYVASKDGAIPEYSTELKETVAHLINNHK
ncbi:MAG: carbohydrate kinase [Lentisphaerota bacterium]